MASNRNPRLTMQDLIDASSHQLYAHVMGIEASLDGDVSLSTRVLDQAIESFLVDVRAEAGHEVASAYAKKLSDTLKPFLIEGPGK